MSDFINRLKSQIQGEILESPEDLKKYSHDASIFEITPLVVAAPKNSQDVQNLVRFVNSNKKQDKNLSLTARGAGSDMSAGPLNDSIILDFQKNMSNFEGVKGNIATTEPGVLYRDFEKETLKHKLIFPPYPASREFCTVGGIVNNNAGGEKTLNWGKAENYIESLDVVLSDGHEYTFRALTDAELKEKIKKNDFEGEVYKNTFKLISENYDLIKTAKPAVSKNSAGYYLWNIYDKETKTFDLTKLFVGAQGTLGLITKIQLKLEPTIDHSQMVIIYLNDIENLAKIINVALPLKPESFESYDDHTFKLATRYFASFSKKIGAKNILECLWHFLPDILKVITGNVPKLVLQVEFAQNDKKELKEKVQTLVKKLSEFPVKVKVAPTQKSQRKYWLFRRESFNLLRKKIKSRHTAPFIDDFEVNPEYLEEFLPKLNQIFANHPYLIYTIAGHIGNGNFHIYPLMDFKDQKQKAIIPKLSEEVYSLVLKYKGTITAEHNDGLVRTPYLTQMYGEKVYKLFEETKKIFDPQNIFNPRKKVGVDINYAMKHLRTDW